MKPYYEHKGISIYHGDCLEIMPELENKSIDMILADPPYGITACKWDSIIPLEPMWEQLKRIIKDSGAIVLTASQPFTTALISSNMKMFKYELIWEKSMPSDVFMAKRKPLKYHENILVFYGNQPIFNPIRQARSEVGRQRLKNNGTVLMGTGKSNITGYNHTGKRLRYDENTINPKSVIKIGSVPNGNRTKFHPTQKPVALMEYLIKTYTNENETVLDFTMGSGTTLIAAKELGRKAIGIEIEEKYCEIAARRLQQEVLFGI